MRRAWTWPSAWGYGSPFVLDVRAVGVFRILFAATLLVDQVAGFGDWHALRSNAGLVPLSDSRDWHSPWHWSVYWLSDGPVLPVALELVRLVATVTLAVGIRSRLSAFVLFVVLSSLATRNPLVLYGGDRVLIVMAFFGSFLPLGGAWSLERLWSARAPERAVCSAGTVAYVVQVLLVWWMSGLHKTGPQWWSDGTALSMALHLEAFVTEFGRLWRGYDWLARPLTFVVVWIECVAPLLVLVPLLVCRLAGLGALAALALGIWVNLEVGLFPWIVLVALVPLVPVPLADAVAGRWRFASGAGAGLTIFIDMDCRFCGFACRLVMAVAGVPAAKVRDARSDRLAAANLVEPGSWSVLSELDGALEIHHGWEALRLVLASSSRPWLLRLIPGSSRGAAVYRWIGAHRGTLGRAGGSVFGHGGGALGVLGGAVAGFALAVVLGWNAALYSTLRGWGDYRAAVRPFVATLGLSQYWSMFSPHPPLRDAWHVVPALGRDGAVVDLLSGGEVVLAPPVNGPRRYGGYRWRQAVRLAQRRGELYLLAEYWCRAGGWAALDVWEFARPNRGTARTADGRYEARRALRWECPGADLGAPVRSFQDAMTRRLSAVGETAP